jgi:hypothetical protein
LGLQFLDFSTILYDFSKLQLQHTKGGRIIFHKSPWNFSEPHNSTLGFITQAPTRLKPMHRDPSGAGELAADEGSPKLGNKRHLAAIRHTRARLGRLVRPERSSAGGGDGAGAARPWRCEVRRRNRFSWATRGRGSFRAS